MQVVVDGMLTDYLVEGLPNQPLVLFLHGWGSSARAFGPLMKGVAAAGFYAVALDFPNPTNVWRVDDFASFVDKFLAKIDTRPFAVIGHSFGGRVILKKQFGAKALVFINSAGVKPLQKSAPIWAAKIGKKIIPKRFHGRFGSSDYRALPSQTARQTFKNIVNEDLTPLMDKIDLPTLLVWGSEDTETPMTDAKIFHDKIKGSRLEVVPAGHYAFLDQPEQVLAKVIDFLKEVRA